MVSPTSNTASFSQRSCHEQGISSYADNASTKRLSSLRIRDMPLEERPRERLFMHGPKVLSMAELLSILIGSGSYAAGQSAIELAHFLLAKIDSSNVSIAKSLQQISVHKLQQIDGIGPAKAAVIVAALGLGKRAFVASPLKGTVIDDPAVAVAALSNMLMWEQQERFAVLHLDIKHRLLNRQVITIGSATETIAHPREIFLSAIERRCTRIILAHNHPSGSLKPSDADIELTKQLLECGKILGIPVLDHLILGNGDFVSLRQTTSLWSGLEQEFLK